MDPPADNPEVVAPPPLLYGAAFVVVLLLRWFWSVPIFGHAALWPGVALVVIGLGIMLWGGATMQAAGTNVIHLSQRHPSSHPAHSAFLAIHSMLQ